LYFGNCIGGYHNRTGTLRNSFQFIGRNYSFYLIIIGGNIDSELDYLGISVNITSRCFIPLKLTLTLSYDSIG
jgi:hypothetical protein